MEDRLPIPGPVRLSDQTLAELPASIKRPRYDRMALTPGIVHIGLGNFHRAHQAWYLHALMQQGLAQDWAIIGAGVRPDDARMREVLLAQDHLTTLIELAPNSRSAEVIGPMIDFLPIEPENGPLIDAIAKPAIRIVTLTVTEGGYFIDPKSRQLDRSHPDIRHDAERPMQPRTAFGAIVAALKCRRDARSGPVTVLSCDNLQGNGDITRSVVVGLAALTDPELAEWIATQCSFPNSMVDCIVPATGPAERALAQELGVIDGSPVTHENYRQWVIEDRFCAGRPEWEKTGATLTDNVHAHETMKIRILNAGHQVLANAGEILSIPTIADCMAHPHISRLFRKVQSEEIVPYVSAVPNMTAAAYVDQVIARFSNTAIRDTTRRVAFDGAARHPGFLLPVLRDALDAGEQIEGLALAEALWARMCEGTREDGTEIAPNDPSWSRLQSAAKAARTTPAAWLEMTEIYGTLRDEPRFATAFAQWLQIIWREGACAAIDRYCGQG